MNKFNPTIRKAPTAKLQHSNNNSSNSLLGMSMQEVVAQCQWKITSGKGNDRHATDETFLNCVTPRIFVADEAGTELHALPQIYANFDNQEDSTAVALANHLSVELLKTKQVPDLPYFFKLIDSKTKLTIATDMPEYEEREESESDLPDFLKAEATVDLYQPDPSVCAFLHIYASQNGKPVRIASRNIEARYQPQVDVAAKLAANGNHMQAGVVPQTKVAHWLESQEAPVSSETDSSFQEIIGATEEA